MRHFSVLKEDAVDALLIKEGGVYVDGTFGAGGHSQEILSRMRNGVLYGFDQDLTVLKGAFADPRLRLRHNNFVDMVDVLKADGVTEVDGVLVDLGVSSMQFDQAERGFSYRFSARLDMRMNQEASRTAEVVVNEYPMERLWSLFSEYGEIRNSKSLAEAIVAERKVRRIETTRDLALIAERMAIGNKMRYLSQLFQAIRIEVNDEVGVLKSFLLRLEEVVRVGGRVVVISFHSLEDRVVKTFFKHGGFDREETKDKYGNSLNIFRMVTRKPIVPGKEELKKNVRSRSAKMRVGERIKE